MNQTDPSHSPTPAGAMWQSVGEIMLPIHLSDKGAIHVSLQEKLDPLQLPAELIHRIERSIQEILQRAATKELALEHAHLFLFIPTDYNARVGSWGFFHIERIESGGDSTPQSHAVDVYLYPDGK